MKYSVEYKNGAFTETLVVDGHEVTKTWKRTENAFGLRCHDKDFADQLTELLDEDICDSIYECFDESMLVADIEDFIIANDVE